MFIVISTANQVMSQPKVLTMKIRIGRKIRKIDAASSIMPATSSSMIIAASDRASA